MTETGENVYLRREDSHLFRDATEKVLILRKTVQDKVYLYVFHYYILYVKTVFQWRPLAEVGVSTQTEMN